MATASEVLTYLRPDGGWVIVGEEWSGVSFIEAEPLTKKQFDDAFALVDAAKAKAEAERLAKKTAAETKLAALGLTSEDLKALGLA